MGTREFLRAIFVAVACLITWHAVKVDAIKWLAFCDVPENMVWDPQNVIQKRYGLTGNQLKFGRKYFDWMGAVHEAACDAKHECREEFKDERWNCNSVSKAPKYDDDLRRDTKESGFLHALSAAAIALKITNYCREGRMLECKCHRPGNKPVMVYTDKGVNYTEIDPLLPCKGITTVGVNFAKMFVENGLPKPKTEEKQKIRAIRMQNSNVGLDEIRNGEEIACICNGPTAGCVYKYCYRRVVQMQVTSEELFRKYKTPIRFADAVEKAGRNPRGNDRTEPLYRVKSQYRESLVYGTASPDHCFDGRTSGRRCELDSTRKNSCAQLCCGRGTYVETISFVKRCNCRFMYQLYKIKCDSCPGTKEISMCN